MSASPPAEIRKVPVYCYQCVAGPDLLTVKVCDGIATEVEPNFKAADVHPAGGRVCVKAFGLIQKNYNPNRILYPMKRTNPKKGRNEEPGFVQISWEEALDTVAAELNKARSKGLIDEAGLPRVAASFGGGGTPTSYMGTLPAFLAAWGPIDMGFGSGQGVKCYHSEHLYGEFWHRAFTVCPDTPLVNYIISFGSNVEASGGVCGVWRQADARVRGAKRVQVEPHLSVTGGCSAEWIPIRPKTDPAFLLAMINVLLHEFPRNRLDVDFLRDRSSSPYLVGPNGYYLRDPETKKPLLWDEVTHSAKAFDTPGIRPALEGVFNLSNVCEIGADEDRFFYEDVTGETAFSKLVAHVKEYSPEWAEQICDVKGETIRRITGEYLDAACVGQTIEIEGRTLPLRPVAITLGKTVNNGWGGYDCCWGRTMIAVLLGGLEVPGGTLGTTVRLNRPADNRMNSVKPNPDGFMDYPMNPTSKEEWLGTPNVRNANRTLIPLVANSPWSQALGPTHLTWLFQRDLPDNWPKPTLPDVWFLYRTNPAISFWDTPNVADTMSKFPFMVAFAYTRDESNHMADILLPDCSDLEGLQIIRIGGTKYVEQFWDHQGFAIRQPVVAPKGEAKDFTFIATELAKRTGLLEAYNNSINRGAHGVPLKTENYDFALDVKVPHDVETIWDASCKAASMEVSEGKDSDGLAWFKENGFKVAPFSRLNWYLYPKIEDLNLRFELPYQERLKRIGVELGRRLHEKGVTWWDEQLEEYSALPKWHDFPKIWERSLISLGGKPDEYPFWLLTTRSMQYAWGGNVGVQMIKEVADNVRGHGGVIINARTAERMGIKEGDLVEVSSPLRVTKGRAFPNQGIRSDVLLMVGQFDHWVTPLAKDFDVPSLNTVISMSLDLTDSTGSGADIARVGLRKVGVGK